MKIVKTLLKKGEWLLDALKRVGCEMIPTNTILNKTLTGLGATHSEIHSKRNSIIIEPNVPVILGKLNDKENLEAVYERCTPHTINKYLKMDIPYKKIMTTPESFKKIRKAAMELNINIYKEYFCLFDECEKLTQDIDYRRKISQPIYDFFQFEQKALVSATPLEMSHPEFERQGFQLIKIEPDYDYKKDLELIVTNSYYKRLRIVLDNLKDSKHICIFFNVTDGIGDLIDNLKVTDYKVFCSQKSVEKLKKRGIINAYEQIDYPLAKYNFFTCRFYSALDILNGKHKPDILILTDLRTAQWTMIDPFTEAIQIQGRFRKKGKDDVTYNSLTHITTIDPNIRVRSKGEIRNRIDQFIANYNLLKEQRDGTEDEFKQKAILEDMESLKYQDLIDERGDINPFSIDNLYNEERVRAYYQSADALYQAYLATGFFNVTYNNVTECVGDDDIERLNNTKVAIKQREQLVNLIVRMEEWFSMGKITFEEKQELLNLIRKQPEGDDILSAYYKIGKDAIVSAEYKKQLIEKKVKEYDKAQAQKLRFSPKVLNEIKAEFPLGIYLPKEDIKQRLQLIYHENGVDYKATQVTIEDYYDCTPSNSKEKPSFMLNFFKL
ncbi:hypothetical protein F2Y83_02900 [Bacteroides cellulosilyticus]|jgi:hypothetical protein|uniref:hypothetical protein n=1 Tax=Bacteroides cellulosilyticus TaxID=246787 RepID=UPI0012311CA8|nr:hypothetical protein [Bacteroides cellulosilyticus]KAA5426455.1 hypothetical protein F2Y70_09505 [Bacteroides cellulosilyticus]KAA5438980.1 hypothetical protein F2Y83_02900 [Bacteroides cellulosilyticus]KAA5441767.1 hypothetical protein F2Y74_04735 [Bacteroides cellulosilyticus]KAA5465194.1 hypothetical protein F2Y53_03010 [Bacteroides cellulosilyticus]UWZ90078.1 hypothetical protein NWT25_02290 [Bacteroides cellulosilyticus]